MHSKCDLSYFVNNFRIFNDIILKTLYILKLHTKKTLKYKSD